MKLTWIHYYYNDCKVLPILSFPLHTLVSITLCSRVFSSPPFIYLFMDLFIAVWTHGFLLHWVDCICYYYYLSDARIFPDLAGVSSLRLIITSSWHTPYYSLNNFYFLAQKYLWSSHCPCFFRIWNQPFIQRSPVPFRGNQDLEPKIWALVMPIATGLLLF